MPNRINMFSGIVQAIGKVLQVQKGTIEGSLTLAIPRKWKIVKGESVAVNGVCLSAREIRSGRVTFDCMAETFRRTALSELKPGDEVNLELPLTLQTLIGGHLVQGHVDGVGIIPSAKKEGKAKVMEVSCSPKIANFLQPKGSITLDGVSLTIVNVSRNKFSVSLIPLTQQVTTLGRKSIGARVNIEVDCIAKMVYKFVKANY